MGCRGPDVNEPDHNNGRQLYNMTQQRDKVTEYLCHVLTELQRIDTMKANSGRPYTPLIANLSLGVNKWWNQHQEIDALRAKDESKALRLKELKESYDMQKASIEEE
jgi:hypothetical protein